MPLPNTLATHDQRLSFSPLSCRPIGLLAPGTFASTPVPFTGVVVNITKVDAEGSAGKKKVSNYDGISTQCLILLLRDKSGVISVRVWHDGPHALSNITLGTQLIVRTVKIRTTSRPGLSSDEARQLPASMIVDISLLKEDGSDVRVYDWERDGTYIARLPPGLGVTAHDIVKLKDLDTSNHTKFDLDQDVKLLVCILDMGADCRVMPDASGEYDSDQALSFQVVDASISLTTFDSLDATPSASSRHFKLSLSTSLIETAIAFTTKHTVLLIIAPRINLSQAEEITLKPRSQVMVDPPCVEAAILRGCVARTYPRVNTSDEIINSALRRLEIKNKTTDGHLDFNLPQTRTQYTWSLFLSQIDLRPHEGFIGYISVIITGMHLWPKYLSHTLFCMPCRYCGRSIHSSARSDVCRDRACRPCRSNTMDQNERSGTKCPGSQDKECARLQPLRFNPQIISDMSDETYGAITPLPHQIILEPNDHKEADPQSTWEHNIVVTDAAIKSLTGLEPHDFPASPQSEKSDDCDNAMETRLKEIERLLRWRRVTLVMAWVPTRGNKRRYAGVMTDAQRGEVLLVDVLL